MASCGLGDLTSGIQDQPHLPRLHKLSGHATTCTLISDSGLLKYVSVQLLASNALFDPKKALHLSDLLPSLALRFNAKYINTTFLSNMTNMRLMTQATTSVNNLYGK